MGREIELVDIWDIQDAADYKVHFARARDGVEPLEVWARSADEWRAWQEIPLQRNEFNLGHIFSLMHYFPEPDTWLFGGIFRVLERLEDGAYRVELTDEGEHFVGRLKLRSAYGGRNPRAKLEERYAELEVMEILREPYSGAPFPGHLSIDLSFGELETIIRNERSDWKAALEHVSGVYVISDARSGRLYVGAAYGEGGVWSRWSDYVHSGHGGNAELQKMVDAEGIKYCRRYFRFALLEVVGGNTPDGAVVAREQHWKQVLRTRGRHGLNRN